MSEKEKSSPDADMPGEKSGHWAVSPSGSASREVVKVEGKDHKVGVGDRAPKPDDKTASEKAPSAATASIGLKAAYQKQFAEGTWASTREGDEDKTFVEALSGKVSTEALAASYDAKAKTAKLTVVNAKAAGTVAHGQIDLIEAIGDLLFGKPSAPAVLPSAPLPPMAARLMDLTAHGTALVPGPGSPNVFVGSMPALRASLDQFICSAPGSPPHGAGPAQLGEPTVFINGMPAIRVGDFVLEPVGGPNVIVMGCPSVTIGSPAAPPPPPPKAADAEEPWVIFEAVAQGDLGDAEAELEADANVDLKAKKGGASFHIGASAALAKVELPLKVRLRIPFTSAYLGLGVTAAGTVGSVGADAGGSVKVNQKDTKTGQTQWFAGSLGAGAHAGLGGASMKFSIDVSSK